MWIWIAGSGGFATCQIQDCWPTEDCCQQKLVSQILYGQIEWLEWRQMKGMRNSCSSYIDSSLCITYSVLHSTFIQLCTWSSVVQSFDTHVINMHICVCVQSACSVAGRCHCHARSHSAGQRWQELRLCILNKVCCVAGVSPSMQGMTMLSGRGRAAWCMMVSTPNWQPTMAAWKPRLQLVRPSSRHQLWTRRLHCMEENR